MKIGILEPQNFSELALNQLKQLGTVEFFTKSHSKDLKSFVSDKEVIFVRLKYFIDNMLIMGSRLKYLCTPTTGLNHISLELQKRSDLKIISLKGESSFLSTIRATPEHTFGLGLALLRNYNKAFINSENNWNRDKYKGLELYNRQVGIIGLGRVGKILAEYLKSFGCQVSFYDIKSNIKHSKDIYQASSISELIKSSSLIFLCASYSHENKKMLSRDLLELMAGKYLVNTARGELIDEGALKKLIKKDHFAGVALDVIANEANNPDLNSLLTLVGHHNLIVTPHISGATFESMSKTEEFIVKKLLHELRKNYEKNSHFDRSSFSSD